jgi:UDP-2,3-diacylglucosamine pyrophosphatase LpxH
LYDREFSEFLLYYQTGEYAQAPVEIILNGDILNLLQADYYGVHTHLMTERSQIYALKKIIAGHPDFFSALRRFAATPSHSIAYVIGNHDVGMMFPGAQRVFSEACGFEIPFYQESYQFDGIYVEHGQQYERFARLDLKKPYLSRGLPEPVLNLPWGSLFVSVLLPKIKQARPHVDKVRPFRAFLVWVLLHDFIWAVKTGIEILWFVFTTIFLRSRYQIFGGVRATWSLVREIRLYPNYDRIAFRILEANPHIQVVIFGHTHILKYRQWKGGKQYFNEGTWNEVTTLDLNEYGTANRLTYAFIEYTGGKPLVRLKQWKGHWRPDQEIVA